MYGMHAERLGSAHQGSIHFAHCHRLFLKYSAILDEELNEPRFPLVGASRSCVSYASVQICDSLLKLRS